MSGARLARLAAVGVIAVLAVVGITLGLGRGADETQAAPTATTAQAAPGEVAESPSPAAPQSPAAPAASADRVALTFEEQVAVDGVEAWQLEDPTSRDTALRARATEEYAALAVTIEPSRVPRSPVEAAQLRNEADGQALVDVTLQDDTELGVLLQMSETGEWLVADILPVESGGA